MILNYTLTHLWKNVFDDNIRHEFLYAYHLSMSFGDTGFAHYGFIGWFLSGTYLNVPLGEIHRRTRFVVAEGKEYASITMLLLTLPIWQVLLNLSGDIENPDPRCLIGEAFDENFSREIKASNCKSALISLHMSEVVLAYEYEDWGFARETLGLNRALQKETEGHFCAGFNYSWWAASHYELFLATGRRKHKKEGRRCHAKVQKWATTGTVMLAGVNKWLTAMESMCVKKAALSDVESLFQEACAALAEKKNSLFEALATERLARLYLTEGTDSAKGLQYLAMAVDLYRRWGALAKAEWLEKRYSQRSRIFEGDSSRPLD